MPDGEKDQRKMYSNLLSCKKNKSIVIHSQIKRKQKNLIKKNKILKKLKISKEENFLNLKNQNDSNYLVYLFYCLNKYFNNIKEKDINHKSKTSPKLA